MSDELQLEQAGHGSKHTAAIAATSLHAALSVLVVSSVLQTR